MRELGRVVANEWMKLLRRRFIVVLLMGACVVGFLSLIIWNNAKNMKDNSPEVQLQNTQTFLADIKAHPQNPNYQQEVTQLTQEVASLKDQVAVNQALNVGDWKPIVQRELAQRQAANAEQIAQASANHLTPNVDMTTQMWLKYSVDHNVRPGRVDQLNPYAAVQELSPTTFRLFIPLLVVILVADMISGEATDGTIKLLLIRPVSRTKILMGKWLVSIFAGTLITLFVSVFLWLTSSLIAGFHGASQPVIVGVTYSVVPASTVYLGAVGTAVIAHFDHARVISYATFTLLGTLMNMVSMIAVASVAFLCSTWLKSAMASTAVSLGIVIFGFIFTQMQFSRSWIVWFFPVQLNFFDTWTGKIGKMTHSGAGLGLGFVVLAVWSIVALIAAGWRFRRQDVLNA